MLPQPARRDAAHAGAVRPPVGRRRDRLSAVGRHPQVPPIWEGSERLPPRFLAAAGRRPQVTPLELRVVGARVERVRVARVEGDGPTLELVRSPRRGPAQPAAAAGRLPQLAEIDAARGARHGDAGGVGRPVERHARVARIRTRHRRTRLLGKRCCAIGTLVDLVDTCVAGRRRGREEQPRSLQPAAVEHADALDGARLHQLPPGAVDRGERKSPVPAGGLLRVVELVAAACEHVVEPRLRAEGDYVRVERRGQRRRGRNHRAISSTSSML